MLRKLFLWWKEIKPYMHIINIKVTTYTIHTRLRWSWIELRHLHKKKHMSGVLTPNTLEVTLFGDRAFTERNQVQMRSLSLVLTKYDWYPYKKGNIWTQSQACTQGDCQVKMKAEISCDTSPSKGMTMMASKPPEAKREAWKRFSLTALSRNNTACTLISDF